MKKKIFIQLMLIFCAFLFGFPVSAAQDRTAISDPSTMDSWQTELSGDSTENSGKVWSDYTVLANPEGKIETGDYGTGGPAETSTVEIDSISVPMDTDFMGVFSLMGKSERMEIEGEYSEPKDVVFVVDVSGTHGYSGLLSSFENGTTRIQRTLLALNKAIDTVMKENDRNRIGVSVYGTSAEVFMPLGRYTSGDGEYIKIIKFFPSGTEGLFTLEVTATPEPGTVLTQTKITNDPYARGDLMDTERTVGMKTNLQSGIRSGMKMLSDEPNTIYLDPVLNIYKPRKPVMMVLSDGQANLAYAEPYYTEEIKRRDNLFDGETDVILQTLLTASYFKNKVESHYMINNLDVHTYGLDLDLEVSDPYKALAYSVLDPVNYFNELGYKDSATNSMVLTAYSKFGNWSAGAIAGTDKAKFPPLPDNSGFTVSDIKAGVYYNSNYSDLNSAFMGDEIFSGELLKVTGDTLHPARGKLEFIAQPGEYMKITDNIGLILFGEYHPAYKYKTSGSTSYYRIGKDGTDRTDIYVNNPAYNGSGSLFSEIEIKVSNSLIRVLIPESLIPLVTCKMAAHSEDDIDFSTDYGTYTPLRLFFGIGIDTGLFSEAQDIQYRYWSFADRRTSRYEVNWSAKEGTMIRADRISDEYLNENWDEERARLKFYANKTDRLIDGGVGLNVSLSLSPSFNNAFYRVADYSRIYTGSDLTGQVTDISGINPNGNYYIGRKIYNGETGKALRTVLARKITGASLLLSCGLYNPETDDRNSGEIHIYPGLLPVEEINVLKTENLTGTTEKNQQVSSGTGVLIKYGNNGLLYNPLSTDLILTKTWIISDGIGEGSQRTWATKGDIITFKIKAVNRSRIYIKDVEIKDVLKYDQWEYIEGSANLNGTYDKETKTVSWILEEMAPGEEAEMTFQVKIADFVEEGTRFHWWNEIENIWRREWVKSDTTAAPVVLSLEKTQGIKGNSLSKNDMVATKDDTITYSLRVKTDSVMEAKNVVVEDILEDGLTYVEGSSNFENVLTVEGQILRWEIGNIPENSFLDITYDVRVDPETEKTVFKNHFTVENFNKNQEGAFTSNETTLHISDPWGLVVSKSVDAQSGTSVTSADRNTEFSYTVNFQGEDGPLTDSYMLLTGNLVSGRVPERPDLNATSKRNFSTDADGSYTFNLRADEYAFFYLIPQGTAYGVLENGKYESGFVVEPQSRTYNGEIGEEIQEVSYKNTKKPPEPVKVSLDGHKVVDMADGSYFNYPLKNGEFSFTLKRNTGNPTGEPVPSSGLTVTNNASGKIVFFEDLEFTRAGTYTYTISEVKGSNTTITYSEDVFTVIVEVSEEYQNGCYTGNLSVSVDIRKDNSSEPGIEFKNLYAPTPAQIEIKGDKTLLEADGVPAEDHSDFEFELEPGEFLPDNNAYLERGTDFNTDILNYYTKYMKNSGDSSIKGIAKITFTDRKPVESVFGSNIIDVSFNKKKQIWMWNEGPEVIVSTREEGKMIYCIDGYRMFKGLGSTGSSTTNTNILSTSLTEIDFLNFDTSLCTNMSSMFYFCEQLTTVGDLSGWNTSNVTSMSSMFDSCSQLTGIGGLSDWNTSNVTSMASMFSFCKQLTTVGDLSGWNTGKVTDMSKMFDSCSQLTGIGGLSDWNTSNVTSMASMFSMCKQLASIDLSGWNTEKVTSMYCMFQSCLELTSVGDLSGWNTSNVTSMSSMFYFCKQLASIGNLSGWNVSQLKRTDGMFQSCEQLTSVGDLSGWNTENVTNMSYMFSSCSQLTDIGDLSGWNTEKVTSMTYMFRSCSQFTDIGDLSGWNTGNVTNMASMFSSCSQLTSVGDLSGWNTEKVTDMSYMFRSCSKLTSVGDLSEWNTGNVQDMSRMFNECSQLTDIGDLSGWNTEKVTDMSYMFNECKQLTSVGDLSGWNTENVTNMSYMFSWCSQLTSLDLSGWNTSKVTSMAEMFRYCSQLTSIGDLSGWDTGKVTSMSYMFATCSQLLSLDLSGWNTEKVTSMSYMFYWCSNLSTIYASDWTSNSKVKTTTSVFSSCSKLPGYSSSKTSGAYCKPISEGGYFTDPSESPNYGKTNNTINAETIGLEVPVETESPIESETFGSPVELLSAPLPLDEEIEGLPAINTPIEEVPLHPYIQMLANPVDTEWPENMPEYLREALSQEDGVFSFGDATFSTAGTYTYYVTERNDGREGVIYNIKRYKVVITAIPNFETGEVESSIHYYDVTDGKEEPMTEVDALHFENKMYAPATAQITGNKTLTGKELTDGAYSFEISADEGTPEDLLPSETTVSVRSDGTIEFPEVTYTRPGDYSYSVKEINNGDKRTEYDPTVYTVTIHVTANDLTRELEASVTTDPDGGIQFKNTYFGGNPNLNIEKLESLDGEYWTDHLTASPEDIITYSLRVWNNGEAPAKNTEVKDDIPEGMTFVEADGDYSLDGSTITWNLGTLLPNVERTLTFKARLPEAENGTLFTNIGYVRSENIDNPDESDDWTPSNEVDVTVVNEAEIVVNKFQGKDTMDPSTVSMIVYGGDIVTYYLDVLSIGASTAKNVVVSDSVPEGLTLVPDSISDDGITSDNVNIQWNLGNMPKGSKKTLSFKVTVPEVTEATTWKNIALYRYSNPPEDSDVIPDTDIPTNEVTINEIPEDLHPEDLKEIEIRKSQSLDSDTFTEDRLTARMEDETVIYKLEITNTGTLDIPDLRVEDEIPEGLTLIEDTISNNGYLLEDGKTLHWDLGFIGVGQVRTVTFSCLIPEDVGSYLNVATGIFSREDPVTPEVRTPSNEVELEKRSRASYSPIVTKRIASSKAGAGINERFSFTLSDFDPQDNVIFNGDATVSITGPGEVTFSPVQFTEEGTYTFLVKEETENPLRGWEFDNTVYKYSVYVEDDGTGLQVKDVRTEVLNI